MIELRDYQLEALDAICADWQTADRTLAVLSTGAGKTIIFLSLLDRLLSSGALGRALILAHQRKLIQQPIERAAQFYPDLAQQMGVVMADENNSAARVIVATVQTLSRPGRIERILSHGPITHIIVDEAHHYTAEVFKRVLDQFPAAKVCGFTATPLRTDGDGLSKIFQRNSYRLPISAAIRRNALVPFNALGVTLPITLAGVKETDDGWERESLGDLLKAENVLQIVCDKWREYAGNRQTIAFTASVAQANASAQYFTAQGIAAAAVSGVTPKAEQDRIAKDFQSGALQVVFNCMIWTEGADFPQASAVMMIAPTEGSSPRSLI